MKHDKVTIMQLDILGITIATSKLGNRAVDIIDYKPNKYIRMNITCMTKYGMDGDQRSKHYLQAISMLFSDNLTLYNHAMELFTQLKAYDKLLHDTKCYVWDEWIKYILKYGFDYTEDGEGCMHVIDNSIQQYKVAL